MLADDSEVAGVEARVTSSHVNQTFPNNFSVVGITSISNKVEKRLEKWVLVNGREMIVAE
jgi:hypothetical protein